MEQSWVVNKWFGQPSRGRLPKKDCSLPKGRRFFQTWKLPTLQNWSKLPTSQNVRLSSITGATKTIGKLPAFGYPWDSGSCFQAFFQTTGKKSVHFARKWEAKWSKNCWLGSYAVHILIKDKGIENSPKWRGRNVKRWNPPGTAETSTNYKPSMFWFHDAATHLASCCGRTYLLEFA